MQETQSRKSLEVSGDALVDLASPLAIYLRSHSFRRWTTTVTPVPDLARDRILFSLRVSAIVYPTVADSMLTAATTTERPVVTIVTADRRPANHSVRKMKC